MRRWKLEMIRAVVGISIAGFVLFFGAAASAQKGPPQKGLRFPVRGKLLRIDGSPWVGARVRLRSYGVLKTDLPELREELEVRSDARGRFEAQLLLGLPYSLWAVETIDAQRYRVSALREGVQAGMKLVVRGAGIRARVKLELRGLDAWEKAAPFRMSYSLSSRVLAWEKLGALEGRVVTLPELPLPSPVFLLRGEQGELIAMRVLSIPGPLRDGESALASTATVLRPARTLLRVIDRQSKRAIVGAKVMRVEGSSRFPVGVTDDRGYVEIVYPSASGRSRNYGRLLAPRVAVSAPGYGEHFVSGRVTVRQPYDRVAMRKAGVANAVLELTPSRRVEGRLRIAGKPAAGMLIAVEYAARTRGGHYFFETPRLERADAEGRFRVDGIPDELAFRLWAVPDLEQRKLLTRGSSLAPFVLLLARKGGAKARTESLDVDLSRLHGFDFEVVHADGSAAQFAQIAFSLERKHLKDPRSGLFYPACFLADRRGRLRMLVHDGGRLSVAAALGFARGATRIAVYKALAIDRTLRIELEGLRTVTARLVSKVGCNPEGLLVRLDCRQRPELPEGLREHWALQSFPRTVDHYCNRSGELRFLFPARAAGTLRIHRVIQTESVLSRLHGSLDFRVEARGAKALSLPIRLYNSRPVRMR